GQFTLTVVQIRFPKIGSQPSTVWAFAVPQRPADRSPEMVKTGNPSRYSSAASTARPRSEAAVASTGTPDRDFTRRGRRGLPHAGHTSSGVGRASRRTLTDSPKG